MKLKDLLAIISDVQKKFEKQIPFCALTGGAPRDLLLHNFKKLSDIDITTGNKFVNLLADETYRELVKKYNIIRKDSEDGHISLYVGKLKLDFSSNYVLPTINEELKKLNINNPTDLQKEMYSRDFTCNTLLLDLELKNIMDPTKQGIPDIKNKIIRTCLPPEVTLTNSKNRVIRAIYLAIKLNFTIDPKIIEYVKNNPESVKISMPKSLAEKLNAATDINAEKTAEYLTLMNLWEYIPMNEKLQPYFVRK